MGHIRQLLTTISTTKTNKIFSRGEQKKLSMFYWIIQVLMLVELNIKPVVLIDDISSELDQEKINSMLGLFSQTRGSNLYYRHREQAHYLWIKKEPLFIKLTVA